MKLVMWAKKSTHLQMRGLDAMSPLLERGRKKDVPLMRDIKSSRSTKCETRTGSGINVAFF